MTFGFACLINEHIRNAHAFSMFPIPYFNPQCDERMSGRNRMTGKNKGSNHVLHLRALCGIDRQQLSKQGKLGLKRGRMDEQSLQLKFQGLVGSSRDPDQWVKGTGTPS